MLRTVRGAGFHYFTLWFHFEVSVKRDAEQRIKAFSAAAPLYQDFIKGAVYQEDTDKVKSVKRWFLMS